MKAVHKLLGGFSFAIAFGCLMGVLMLFIVVVPDIIPAMHDMELVFNTIVVAAIFALMAAIGAYRVGVHLFHDRHATSGWVRTLGIFSALFLIMIAGIGVLDPATPELRLVVVPAMLMIVATLLIRRAPTDDNQSKGQNEGQNDTNPAPTPNKDGTSNVQSVASSDVPPNPTPGNTQHA